MSRPTTLLWLPALRWLGACALFFSIILVIQQSRGAASGGFGGAADEPAHYIGGLLVHDYLRAGLPGSPMAFAREYYAHLPYFGIGVWPPLFYLLEGLWMLLFGTSRFAALVLVALCSAALAATLYGCLRQRYGDAAALAAGALLLLLPGQQWVQCYVMVDTATALLAFLALLPLARLLESGRFRDSLTFGVLAAAALLTKYSAWYLALIPLPAIAIGRAWPALRRPALWVAAPVVAGLELPWLLVAGRNTFLNFNEMKDRGLLAGFSDYAGALAFSLPYIAIASAVGLVLVLVRGRSLPPLLWCAAAAVPALGLSIAIPRVPLQGRLLTVGCAASLILAAEALLWAGRRWGRQAAACGLAIVLALLIHRQWRVSEHLPPNDVRPLVEYLHIHEAGGPVGSLLTPSRYEGRWIAEFALRETRPGRVLLRPGKLLGEENWIGVRRADTRPGQAAEFLTRVPCRYVALADRVETPYDADLKQHLENHPDQWQALYRGPAFTLYQNRAWQPGNESGILRIARGQLTRSLN